METNNCPKPECGRPESTHRFKAGKRLSICGNSHHWDQVEVAAQRRKAEEAKRRENEVRIRVEVKPGSLDEEAIKRHYRGGVFDPFMR